MTDKPKMRRPFERLRVYTPIGTQSMTAKEHASSVNINKIIERYDRTGQIPPGNGPGYYGDVTEITGKDFGELVNDRKEALERLHQVENELAAAEVEREQARLEELEKAKNVLQTDDQETPKEPPSS